MNVGVWKQEVDRTGFPQSLTPSFKCFLLITFIFPFKNLFTLKKICMCACLGICIQVPTEARRGCRIPAGKAAGGCELPYMDAGN